MAPVVGDSAVDGTSVISGTADGDGFWQLFMAVAEIAAAACGK